MHFVVNFSKLKMLNWHLQTHPDKLVLTDWRLNPRISMNVVYLDGPTQILGDERVVTERSASLSTWWKSHNNYNNESLFSVSDTNNQSAHWRTLQINDAVIYDEENRRTLKEEHLQKKMTYRRRRRTLTEEEHLQKKKNNNRRRRLTEEEDLQKKKTNRRRRLTEEED